MAAPLRTEAEKDHVPLAVLDVQGGRLPMHVLLTQRITQERESISTGRFGTSMSAHHILGLEKVPRIRLFAD